MRKKLTTEEFVERANKIHRGIYDYSEVNYTGVFNKVNIICKTHGKFSQVAHLHLRNRGCPNCKKNSKIFTTEEFIRRATQIHGDKYDYSTVKFKNSMKKI